MKDATALRSQWQKTLNVTICTTHFLPELSALENVKTYLPADEDKKLLDKLRLTGWVYH